MIQHWPARVACSAVSPLNSRLLSVHTYLVPLLLLDKYAVRFIPHENGIHTIDVKFNGSHVVGSPFKVRVGEPGQAGNPALVSAYGAGLEVGTTGKKRCFPCSPYTQLCLGKLSRHL